MAGEIHGVISRDDAWRMWKPYGERVELDGSVAPENMTPFEAVQIAFGADLDTQNRILGYRYNKDDQRFWLDILRDNMAKEPSPDFVAYLASAQVRQQKHAELEREKAIAGGLHLTRLLGKAAIMLRESGILTTQQADTVHDWLVGADGKPYMQYTPMSRLEYARSYLKYYKDEPSLANQNGTDFNLGVVKVSLLNQDNSHESEVHNRIHESVHANFSGLEMNEITREDGWRHPEPSVVGLFAGEPTTRIVRVDSYGNYKNAEVTEGWTDLVAREAMRLVPELGHPLKDAQGYGEWAKMTAKIRQNFPELFQRITEAIFVEAAPAHPLVKREAIVEVNMFADDLLGEKDSLTKLYQTNGGDLIEAQSESRISRLR